VAKSWFFWKLPREGGARALTALLLTPVAPTGRARLGEGMGGGEARRYILLLCMGT
jgi:hypothetical protein